MSMLEPQETTLLSNLTMWDILGATADGAAGKVLTTDGSGNLSFSAASGGVAIDDTIAGATQGSVLFIDDLTGVLAQDNTIFTGTIPITDLESGDNQVTVWMLAASANTIGIFRSSDATARISFKDSSTTSDTHVGIKTLGTPPISMPITALC